MFFPARSVRSLAAAALVLTAGSVGAETPPQWDRPRQEISDAWRVRKQVISVGNDLLGAKQLDQIRKIQNVYSLTALPAVSTALLREIQERGSSQAAERLQFAETFTPGFSAVPYFRCANGNDWPACLEGVQIDLGRNDWRVRFLSNLFFTALRAFAVLSLLFAAFYLFRYGVPISRAVSNSLRWVSPGGVALLVLMVSVLAWQLAGWIGPWGILFFLFWRYLRRGERWPLLLFWIPAVAFPLALYAPAFSIRYESGATSILDSPPDGMLLAEEAGNLRKWVASHPDDTEALFVLARIEKETGRYGEARALYRKAAELRPAWHKPVVNLATIEYIEKDPEEAVALLQKAISISPQSVVAHFNLGKIFLDLRRLDEARSSLTRSKDIDAQRFAELDRASNASETSEFLIDESLSPEEVSSRIWRMSPDLTGIRDSLYRHFFPAIPLPLYWTLLGVSLLLAAAMNRKWPTGDILEEYRSTEERPRSSSLDIFDPNLSRAFKREYSPLHAFWEKFRERWCTLLLPGSHHLSRSNHGAAFCWMFLSLWPLVTLLTRHRLLGDPRLLPGLPGFPLPAVLWTCFGLVYVLQAVRAIRS